MIIRNVNKVLTTRLTPIVVTMEVLLRYHINVESSFVNLFSYEGDPKTKCNKF